MADNSVSRTPDIGRQADTFYNRYREHMDILEGKDSMLKKVRPITQFDFYALGKQLEQFEDYKSMCEDEGSVAQLGRVPDIALDVITVNYASSPIGAMASVQPIDEERGIVYYRNVVAATTRGNVTSGQVLLSPNRVPDVSPVGFAGDLSSATSSATIAGTLSYTFSLPNFPVRPGTINIAVSGAGTYTTTDNGVGLILGRGISGTVSYNTGVVAVDFASDPGAGRNVTASYQTDFESSTDIPKILAKFDSKLVSARVFALKTTIGVEQSFSMKKRFGMIAEDEAASDLVSAMNTEIANTAILQLSAAAPATAISWTKTAPANYSYAEYKQTIFDVISQADTQILGTAGRGSINVLIAGRSAAAILSTLPQFTRLAETNSFGPHIFGTLNGIVVVRVVDAAVLDPYTLLGLYKGTTAFDAPLVYSPYMPLLITGTLPLPNPLLNQKAAAIWSGIDILVPNFIVKIVFV